MHVAIVYDSSTGRTKAAAEQMGDTVREAGHTCDVSSVLDADPATVSQADAICIGSWTKGLFVILQSPTEASLEFIDKLDSLDGKPSAVFVTYTLAIGKTLKKMASRLTARGAKVTGEFKSKGPKASPDFAAWVKSLGAAG